MSDIMTCIGCLKHPDEIDEYIDASAEEDMTPVEYVIQEEGTYNGFEKDRFIARNAILQRVCR